MKKHADVGEDIIGEHDSALLKMTRSIALTHHEKWNGSGYPQGLKRKEAVAYTNSAADSHFDPELIKCFNNVLPDILVIKDHWEESKYL
jgi:putative two-component system response regulator